MVNRVEGVEVGSWFTWGLRLWCTAVNKVVVGVGDGWRWVAGLPGD